MVIRGKIIIVVFFFYKVGPLFSSYVIFSTSVFCSTRDPSILLLSSLLFKSISETSLILSLDLSSLFPVSRSFVLSFLIFQSLGQVLNQGRDLFLSGSFSFVFLTFPSFEFLYRTLLKDLTFYTRTTTLSGALGVFQLSKVTVSLLSCLNTNPPLLKCTLQILVLPKSEKSSL